jgi:arginase
MRRTCAVVRSGVSGSAQQGTVILEVPSALGLHPNGVQDAPAALREAGLQTAVGAVRSVRVDVPPYDPVRNPTTGVRNGYEIGLLARRLADHVEDVFTADGFPLVVGGDCSIVLGPLFALHRRGRYGLAFVDGHADFCHPDDEPTGEAASLDLALATGRGPASLSDLGGLGPLVKDGDVALIGYRAFGDNDHYLAEHVRDTAIAIVDLPHLRRQDVQATLRFATKRLSSDDVDGYWVHFDVDALDDDLMPAVDHHHPGGLTWEEAEDVLAFLLGAPGAVGMDITIYNPRLDPERELAARLVSLCGSALQARTRRAKTRSSAASTPAASAPSITAPSASAETSSRGAGNGSHSSR